ncbi:MAG: hypothetical protein COA45_09880 [Zetaproteobacteria bacterium]|nr:MAG: hypothetical protein COA45_09880 [Zetaproteobacteria bacterium]
MAIYDQPLSNVLSTGQFINSIVSGWTPEYREQWAQTYPDSVDFVLNDYSFCIITHPEFQSGAATQAQIDQANDIFASNWESLGQYASAQTASDQLTVLSSENNLSGIEAIASNVSDEAILGVSPQIWSSVIQSVTDAPFYPPLFPDQDSVSVEQSNAVLRELMETLNTVTDVAGNPVDITNVINVWDLGYVLQTHGFNGNLGGIDAIVDNLSGQALSFVNPSTWYDVIQSITDAPYFPPTFPDQGPASIEQSNAALRELMETLNTATDAAGNPIDITNVVDIFYLGNTLDLLGWNSNLGGIDAIVDNLSSQALAFVPSYNWSNVIQSITDAPYLPPIFPDQDPVSVEQSNTALRELMETLNTATDIVGNPIDITYLIDVLNVGNVLQTLGYNGNLGGIDAIVDNLSSQALSFVNPSTWSSVIESITNAPFNPPLFPDQDPVSVEQSNAALRELMETLNTATDIVGNPIDITYLIDVSNLGYVVDNIHLNGNGDGLAAIVENLSDTALGILGDFSTAISDGKVEVGSSANDILYGSNSDIDVNLVEAIYGLGGDDVIIGGSGNTSSYGGDGDDIVYDLYGGDDIISGGDGSDQLYGGSGDDTFVFNKGETGVDTIYAFAEGDKIDLSDLLSGYNPLTDAIEDFIVITQVGSSTQMVAVDADGTGAGSAVDITSVNTSTGLDMNDFITTIDEIV